MPDIGVALYPTPDRVTYSERRGLNGSAIAEAIKYCKDLLNESEIGDRVIPQIMLFCATITKER